MTESQRIHVFSSEEITYKLMRSKKRRRSISMKFNKQGQLQINVPYRISQAAVDEFITAKYQWIKTNQYKNEQSKKQELLYIDGEMHLYQGCQYMLYLIQAKSSHVILKDNQMHVFHRKNASIKNILDRWYKQSALEYLIQRTQFLAQMHDFPKINAIKIRNMTARWGSCSSRSEITYNTHLIKTSLESIDYVIIHELCHLIHHNHSSRFYQLQSKINPQWKTQKQTLNHSKIL